MSRFKGICFLGFSHYIMLVAANVAPSGSRARTASLSLDSPPSISGDARINNRIVKSSQHSQLFMSRDKLGCFVQVFILHLLLCSGRVQHTHVCHSMHVEVRGQLLRCAPTFHHVGPPGTELRSLSSAASTLYELGRHAGPFGETGYEKRL